MAEGFLKSLDPELEVHSAGTRPAPRTHPDAVAVMREAGIDISAGRPKNVDEFLERPFDWVITVCGDARETCPAFTGTVGHHVHIGFDDPAWAEGTREQVLGVFRRVRDEIREQFGDFYRTKIKNQGGN